VYGPKRPVDVERPNGTNPTNIILRYLHSEVPPGKLISVLATVHDTRSDSHPTKAPRLGPSDSAMYWNAWWERLCDQSRLVKVAFLSVFSTSQKISDHWRYSSPESTSVEIGRAGGSTSSCEPRFLLPDGSDSIQLSPNLHDHCTPFPHQAHGLNLLYHLLHQ